MRLLRRLEEKPGFGNLLTTEEVVERDARGPVKKTVAHLDIDQAILFVMESDSPAAIRAPRQGTRRGQLHASPAGRAPGRRPVWSTAGYARAGAPRSTHR